MTLDELFANDESLPTVPKVVSDLMEMLRDDEVPFAAVAHRIELDQVLAAKVLQMVNSPFFGLRRKISSIQGAILMLGLSTIRSFVVSSGLSGAFRGSRASTFRLLGAQPARGVGRALPGFQDAARRPQPGFHRRQHARHRPPAHGAVDAAAAWPR
jgi:hypothetical protein